jgi:Flp pilus assembly pilin Flp
MNIRNQDGVAMTEYALIIGLLVLVVVVVVTLFGERLGDYYTNFIDMFIELLN